MKYSTQDSEFDIEIHDIPLTIKYTGWEDTGRTSGPPENCYPPEGELDFQVFIGEDDITALIAGDILKKIEDACWERLRDDARPYEEQRADFEYDRMREDRYFS